MGMGGLGVWRGGGGLTWRIWAVFAKNSFWVAEVVYYEKVWGRGKRFVRS
jgi:hypothetical protein